MSTISRLTISDPGVEPLATVENVTPLWLKHHPEREETPHEVRAVLDYLEATHEDEGTPCTITADLLHNYEVYTVEDLCYEYPLIFESVHGPGSPADLSQDEKAKLFSEFKDVDPLGYCWCDDDNMLLVQEWKQAY